MSSSSAHLNDSTLPSHINTNHDNPSNPSNQQTVDQESSTFSSESAVNDDSQCQKDATPKTVREEKLLGVSRLFQLCYRTVIPNRLPALNSPANALSQGMNGFNSRPFGKHHVCSEFDCRLMFVSRPRHRSFD
jgi:hypothetical protein